EAECAAVELLGLRCVVDRESAESSAISQHGLLLVGCPAGAIAGTGPPNGRLPGGCSFMLPGRLPEPHHPALGVGEEAEPAHARHFLFRDMDLAAGCDDALAVRGE